jgi:hypothetical protein
MPQETDTWYGVTTYTNTNNLTYTFENPIWWNEGTTLMDFTPSNKKIVKKYKLVEFCKTNYKDYKGE